jgi:hypothetical protein
MATYLTVMRMDWCAASSVNASFSAMALAENHSSAHTAMFVGL